MNLKSNLTILRLVLHEFHANQVDQFTPFETHTASGQIHRIAGLAHVLANENKRLTARFGLPEIR